MTLPGNSLQDYTIDELNELLIAINYGIAFMDFTDSKLSMTKRIEILNQFSVKIMESKLKVRETERITES